MLLSKVFILVILLGIIACNKSFIIKDVNYAQYVESVLYPNELGIVTDYLNNISFSIHQLSKIEFGDNDIDEMFEIRMIRNHLGYYFITANEFKHVYVFQPQKGQLKLKESIAISEKGLVSPIFNWREPYVEIIANNREEVHYLNESGIISEKIEETKK